MTCCPEGSLDRLGQEGYQPTGQVVTRQDLPIYVVGSGPRCVIWNYDIFGFSAGRTRQFCDLLAEAGYLVLLPDWYRGTWQDPTQPGVVEFLQRTSQWGNIKSDWDLKVKPLAIERGAQTYGTVGVCWGSYPVIRLCGLPEFCAGVSVHPSHPKISAVLELEEKPLLEEITAKQLFMPAGNDGDTVKEGGLARQVLGDRIKIVEFSDMAHGFFTRGDMAKPEVARDVRAAMEELLTFMKENL